MPEWPRTNLWVEARKAGMQQMCENLELRSPQFEVFVYDQYGVSWKWSINMIMNTTECIKKIQ